MFFLILYIEIHCLNNNNKNKLVTKLQLNKNNNINFNININKNTDINNSKYNKNININFNNTNTSFNNNSNRNKTNKNPFEKTKEKVKEKVNKNPIFISKLRHKLINEISDSDILEIYNLTDNKENKNKNKNKNKFINQNQENYIFNISDIETKIKISKEYSYGIIKDKIKFELPKGLHNTILHKISIGGTSNKFHSFRVLST
jgi:hypothetical protein